MEPRRNCCAVIAQMMEKIPSGNDKLVKDLKWNLEDASYKAPEQNIQWQRTMKTIQKHFPDPKEDWEFEVLSIFTTKTAFQLKKEIEKNK